MNISGSTNPQTLSNASTSSLAKPNGSMSDDSKKNNSETLDKMTSDDLAALVNIIVLLIGGLRSPSAGAGNVGGSPFNSSSGTNFILDFPKLPSMMGSSDDGAGTAGSNDDSGSEGSTGSEGGSGSNTSLKFPPLPSFNLGNSSAAVTDAGVAGSEGNTGTTGQTTGGSSSNSDGNILSTRPIPSLVSSTGSLSTAGAPRAFNPPAIPSLLGNSTQLPSASVVGNAADSSLSTGSSTSPQVSSGSGSASVTNSDGSSATGNTVLATNQLPSLVGATGSLSTPDIPKAFNPPSIASLTGGSSELPLVSASDSQPITSGLSSSTNTASPSGSSAINNNSNNNSNGGGASSTIFNVPAIPSLLGSGGTIDSLVASLESGSSSSSNSGSGSTSNNDQSRVQNSHFTSGS